MKRKLLSLLVLLITAVTGAWAENTYKIVVTSESSSFVTDAVSLPYKKEIRELIPNASIYQSMSYSVENIVVSGDNIEKGTDNGWNTEITINGVGTGSVSARVSKGDYHEDKTITIDVSGYCGDPDVHGGKDVTWTLSSGVLTISGSGAMANYDDDYSQAPWLSSNPSYQEDITSVVIESGVTSIGDCSFYDCIHLVSVSIPASVTSIGDGAFLGCGTDANTALTVTFATESTLMTIGDHAFQYSHLGSITIPASVTCIGEEAFSSCGFLTTINIPASVTSIGIHAFGSCGLDANALTVTFATGSTLTTISEGVFSNCYYLTTIDIPASVTSIGAGAFFGCIGLTTIDIPASVTSIGDDAFSWCANLATVTLNSNPFIGDNAFVNIKDGAKVTMNLTAKSAGGANWMTFYNKKYSFVADENTQVFKVALSGDQLTMHEVENGIVDAGTAVVLKSSGNPVMTLTTTASGDSQTNNLKGVAGPGVETSDGTMYVLNYKDGIGVGFYKLTSGKTLGVGKAYLTYSAGAREFIGFGNTTSIQSIDNGQLTIDNVVYDLQGRRVSQPTKGLYIVNGKKVVVK